MDHLHGLSDEQKHGLVQGGGGSVSVELESGAMEVELTAEQVLLRPPPDIFLQHDDMCFISSSLSAQCMRI